MVQKKILVGMLLALVIISSALLVNANDMDEFLKDDVTQLKITIGQNYSQVDLYLNTSNANFDEQSILIQNETIDGNYIEELLIEFNISTFLNGINGQVETEKDSNVPKFNYLNIDDVVNSIFLESIDGNELVIDRGGFNITGSSFSLTTYTFFHNIVNNLNQNIDLKNETSVNNYLEENPLSDVSPYNIIFTKNGTNYTIWSDEGLEEIPYGLRTQVEAKIKNSVLTMNFNNLSSGLTPFLNKHKSELEENFNAELLFHNLETNYTVGEIDFSHISFEDGEYTIPVPINDSKGNQYNKNITLIFDGILPVDKGNVTNGVYIPYQAHSRIQELIQKISNLNASEMSVQILESFNSKPSNAKTTFTYMDLTPDNPNSSATIEFKIKSNLIENVGDVSLYRLHDGIWDKLPTSYIGDSEGAAYSLFTSDIPGFSIFAIAEEDSTTSTSSGSSGGSSSGGGGSIIVGDSQTSPSSGPAITTDTPGPIDLDENPGQPKQNKGFFASITGAFIGTLGTGGSIIALVFVFLIVGLVIFINLNKKLNEKGDEGEL